MGYTQYWDHRGFTDEEWRKLVTFTRNLISNTTVPIVNGSGDEGTSPEINDCRIFFNGEGDESCETFNLTKAAQDFEFCKTRGHPYDKVVVAVMCESMELNRTFNPRSDGGKEVFGVIPNPRTVMGHEIE
jgi:hypothetical protein